MRSEYSPGVFFRCGKIVLDCWLCSSSPLSSCAAKGRPGEFLAPNGRCAAQLLLGIFGRHSLKVKKLLRTPSLTLHLPSFVGCHRDMSLFHPQALYRLDFIQEYVYLCDGGGPPPIRSAVTDAFQRQLVVGR